ncbi:MAG: hypothetical protein ACP5NV_03670 [Candidatus Woesearchaeota archaeon]
MFSISDAVFRKFPGLELKLSGYDSFGISVTPIETDIYAMLQSARKSLNFFSPKHIDHESFDQNIAAVYLQLQHYNGRFKNYFSKSVDSLNEDYRSSLGYGNNCVHI